MALLGPFDRPHALRLLGFAGGAVRTSCQPLVPPPVVAGGGGPVGADVAAKRLHIARFLTMALLVETRSVTRLVAEIVESVHERVVAWSPTGYVTSRNDLIATLLESDDAIGDVSVSIVGEGVAGPTTYVEWRLTGRFSDAAFLNDDVLVEPSGATVESAGVLVLTFSGERVVCIRCYYDGLGLLEQVLPAV